MRARGVPAGAPEITRSGPSVRCQSSVVSAVTSSASGVWAKGGPTVVGKGVVAPVSWLHPGEQRLAPLPAGGGAHSPWASGSRLPACCARCMPTVSEDCGCAAGGCAVEHGPAQTQSRQAPATSPPLASGARRLDHDRSRASGASRRKVVAVPWTRIGPGTARHLRHWHGLDEARAASWASCVAAGLLACVETTSVGPAVRPGSNRHGTGEADTVAVFEYSMYPARRRSRAVACSSRMPRAPVSCCHLRECGVGVAQVAERIAVARVLYLPCRLSSGVEPRYRRLPGDEHAQQREDAIVRLWTARGQCNDGLMRVAIVRAGRTIATGRRWIVYLPRGTLPDRR